MGDYWFGVAPSDPEVNAEMLGEIQTWAKEHDQSKQRGFYVDLDDAGDAMAPSGEADEASLRAVIKRVHQIGWQLRLGEHIEGKRQDEQERGIPPMEPEAVAGIESSTLGDVMREHGTWDEARAGMLGGLPVYRSTTRRIGSTLPASPGNRSTPWASLATKLKLASWSASTRRAST